ncbi:chemotaxis protein CheF1 [Halonotius terrestris]|uniref:Taxis protein CheF n=1 Tax=Halonotius terrestris TaxID=2487750 RepID=A0A8J8TC54_9EURY|nr:CheF family chemotaxis protein [Halonotius terrestris]TQQ82832.1 chemotaxis protein CheF1 [Halonotius terrestris]
MGEEEYQIADTKGRFTMAVKNGRKLNDISWSEGRLLLSNKRLILVGGDGKRTIKLSDITGLSGREDSTQSIAALSNYLSLRLGEDVLVVSANNHEEFKLAFYKAVLDEAVIKAKHPAVEGGVIQDTEWQKARLAVESESLLASLKNGSLVEMELSEISGLNKEKRTVDGQKRPIIEVSHAVDSTSLETHLMGPRQVSIFAYAFLQQGERESETNVDLEPSEKEVLMALHSGISPFSIPEFIGQDVDDVEETFEKLIELDIVDKVRERREVTLNARGRNIASEAMGDQ